MRTLHGQLMATAAVGLAAESAFAIDYTWNAPAPGSGAFESPLFWSPFNFHDPSTWGPPAAGEMATFNLGNSAYAVNFASNPVNSRCRIGDDNVTFNLNGHTYTLTSTGSVSMLVPYNAQHDAVLTMLGGTVNAHQSLLAAAFPSSATVTVGSSAAWNLANQLVVGMFDQATLNILEGGDVSCASAILGNGYNGVTQFGEGTVNMVGGGSTFDVNGILIVGNQGDAVVTMSQNAGLFTSNATSFGVSPGASGSLTIGESLSVWTANSSIYLGGSASGPGGTGALTINPGGVVNVTSPPFHPTLFIRPGSTINLAGGALLAIVENQGGTFNWTSGSFIHRAPLALVPGPLFPSPLTLDDGATSLSVFDLLIADDGAVNVSNGALVSGSGALRMADGQMTVATSASLYWLGGGSIGEQSGDAAVITLDGALWSHSAQNAMELNIGDAGSGSVSVLGGSQFTISEQSVPSLGRQGGSEGELLVSGTASQCSVANHPLYVGSFGTGSVTVDDGGSLDLYRLLLGENPGGEGNVAIDGADSSITSGLTIVGVFGSGALSASGGATVTVSGICTVGDGAESSGQVVVRGAGSMLSIVDDGELFVGGAGEGSLDIADGASAQAVEVVIGDGTGSVGIVELSGAGSQLVAEEAIAIGLTGAASVTLGPGTSLAAPLIDINVLSSLSGSGIVTGSLSSAGEVAPGLSARTLTVDGEYIQTRSGMLQIELGGLAAGVDHDVLAITGPVQLDGTLSVALINGFVPQPGDCFAIITTSTGTIVGAFAAVQPPGVYEVTYDPGSVTLCVPDGSCPTDLTGDGTVNVDDLLAVINAWGACANPNDCPADIAPPGPPMGDDIVNVDDLLAVINAWGACP